MTHYRHEFEDYFIVGNMPLEVYKLSRSSRSKMFIESFKNSPNRGYCSSQFMSCFGYKLYAVCSISGVIEN